MRLECEAMASNEARCYATSSGNPFVGHPRFLEVGVVEVAPYLDWWI